MKTKINKLKEIDKTKNPFKVPDNYFAQFNEEIMSRLPEKEIVALRPVPLWDKVKPWVYLAAMFLGIYITVNFLTRNADKEQITAKQSDTLNQYSVTESVDKYCSTKHITEEEFYQILE
jgi:hypothetical protein